MLSLFGFTATKLFATFVRYDLHGNNRQANLSSTKDGSREEGLRLQNRHQEVHIPERRQNAMYRPLDDSWNLSNR